MKNKGKKFYFTFMALGLAVTMLLSSSITLAFFGSSSSGTSTVKMGNAVEVDSSIEVQSSTLYVSPSQNVDIDATATVKSPGTTGNETDALLRAKITSSTSLTNVAVVPSTTVNGTTAYWTKSTDGYYYLVTAQNGTTCYTIETTTTGVAVPLKISVIVPSNLSNADSGTAYRVNVVFCAIQSRIYNDTAQIANIISNVKSVFDDVEGISSSGTVTKIMGNSELYGNPSPTSPVEIVSVGEKTKNLLNINAESIVSSTWHPPTTAFDFDFSKMYIGYAGSGYFANGNKISNISVEGSTLKFTGSSQWYGLAFPIEIKNGATYTLSWKTNSGDNIRANISYYKDGLHQDDIAIGGADGTLNRTFTNNEGYDAVVISIVPKTVNTEISAYDIMFSEDSVATDYEPYGKYKIPVSVDGNITNIFLDEPLRKVGNYADYIDFTTGKVVRQIKSTVIDENSSFGKFSGVTNCSAFYCQTNDMVSHSQNGNNIDVEVMSDSFIYHACSGASWNACWTGEYQIGGSVSNVNDSYRRICFSLPTTITDVASAKEWLKEHPITVYYPMATETYESIDLPTLTGSSITVNTSVQPTIVVE